MPTFFSKKVGGLRGSPKLNIFFLEQLDAVFGEQSLGSREIFRMTKSPTLLGIFLNNSFPIWSLRNATHGCHIFSIISLNIYSLLFYPLFIFRESVVAEREAVPSAVLVVAGNGVFEGMLVFALTAGVAVVALAAGVAVVALAAGMVAALAAGIVWVGCEV